MSSDEQKSVNFVLAAVDRHHGTKFSDLSDSKKRAMFYKVQRSAQYKTVFFLSFNFDSPAGKLCAHVRKASRQHSGRSGRSYTVNVFSGKVTMMCFNDKCKKRNGARKYWRQARRRRPSLHKTRTVMRHRRKMKNTCRTNRNDATHEQEADMWK